MFREFIFTVIIFVAFFNIAANTNLTNAASNPDCSELTSSIAPNWCDGFNGSSIDTNKWTNTDYGSWDSWPKTEASNGTNVSNGQIHFKLSNGGARYGKSYTGFGMETDAHNLQYGCWETRAKLTTTGDKRITGYIGLYPPSWTAEVDFFETSGNPGDTTKNFFTQHSSTGNDCDGGAHHCEEAITNLDLTQFHTYSVEITSSQMKWYVDGSLITTQTNNSPGINWHPVAGLWACGWENGGNTCSGIASLPQYMDIDYFAIWDNKSCPSTGPGPSPTVSPSTSPPTLTEEPATPTPTPRPPYSPNIDPLLFFIPVIILFIAMIFL